MSDVQRWKDMWYGDDHGELVPREDGEYVRYADHAEALAEAERDWATLAGSDQYAAGYAAALDAAREAVARQCGHTKSVSTNYECDHDRAIAAINALQDALQDDLSRYE